MMSKRPTVSLISLGCPRTLVDSELYLGRLKRAGFEIVEAAERSDVAIINTCSFIQESIEESIETILEAVELKRRGALKAVVVAGCLVQRFKEDLVKELPEVDGFVGVDGFGDIETVVQRALTQHPAGGAPPVSVIRPRPRTMRDVGSADRVALTASHFAYLKVSEGCLKGCSFCVIPKIKGPLASRPIEALVDEAKRLVEERGVVELIVVGQDTSDYGIDRYGRPRIAELLRALARIEGLAWIRLLYFHPRGMSRELIETIRDEPRICKYLDMAIEHADNGVLRRMNRRITRERLTDIVTTLRAEIPAIALRTSVIVGFPGETDAAFENLLTFIRTSRFERLGAFRYSNEEGSAAFRYPDQVPESVKQERFERLMLLQQDLARQLNAQWLGKQVEVLIDEPDPSDPTLFWGRTSADCPEVDGMVYVQSPRGRLSPGQFVYAKITDTYEYDLVAELVESTENSECGLRNSD